MLIVTLTAGWLLHRLLVDSFTKPISEHLQADVETVSGGKRPHLIIVNLQRRKLDANRDKAEATFGDVESVRAWDTFHHYIDQAKASMGDGAAGLLLDIHGLTRSTVELGYRISKSRINANNYGASTRELSSICALVKRTCDGGGVGAANATCFRQIVRGAGSLGERLTASVDADRDSLGYIVLPSVSQPASSSYSYFTGGYNVKRHGSAGCGAQSASSSQQIDAIQVETPRYIRFSSSKRQAYAYELAEAVVAFMDEFYAGW